MHLLDGVVMLVMCWCLLCVGNVYCLLQMSSDPDYQHTSDTGDSSSKQTSSKKRTRGPTVLDRISKVRATGQKIPVETNYNGVPIEDSGKDLMTYLGIVTRDIVPINMASWGEVPKYLKDNGQF